MRTCGALSAPGAYTLARTAYAARLPCERADMCIAALSVERTVAQAVGYWQRTQPESISLTAYQASHAATLVTTHERAMFLPMEATASKTFLCCDVYKREHLVQNYGS